ncbi:phospholipid carrier-dependent glycosyltransferase [bacterium]|nr:MAG: phospholipid carrier-dependent glycosyltransferase [bacterium]
MQQEKARNHLWLVLLLAGSFALRLWLASVDLHAGRFWDERFNMANVAAVLRGSLRPANAWYQGLSYLPQAALLALSREAHRLTGWEALAVTGSGGSGFGGFTPWAYFLCRLLQTVYGTLSLLATYLLGRKLFPETAMLGAFLLAVTPRHLHASVIFKPDILLLLWTVVAFVWILDAVARPALRTYLLAGLGVGLCLATKLNGGLVAIPLVAGTAALLGKVRRVWLWLTHAGVVAAAVFLLFNPFVGMQVAYFGRNLEHYDAHATTTHLEAFLETLAFPFSNLFHGAPIGLAAVLGGAWVAASAIRRGWSDIRSLRELVFLSYPLSYVALYAIATTRAKQNHFLQILPFTSLLAAFFLLGALSWLSGVASRLVFRKALLAVLAGWLSVRTVARVYEQAVPENRVHAGRFLHKEMPDPRRGRLIYAETAVSPRLPGKAFFAAGGLRTVDRLETVSPQTLDLADAEVFPLSAAGSAFYQRRVAAAGPVVGFRSRPLLGRGKGVGVLFHPWAPAGSREETVLLLREGSEQWLAGSLHLEEDRGEVISLGLWLPRGEAGSRAELVVGGERLPLVRLEGKPRKVLYLFPRFILPNAGEVVLCLPAQNRVRRKKIDLQVYRWKT